MGCISFRTFLAKQILLDRAPAGKSTFIGRIAQQRTIENYKKASAFVSGKRVLDIGPGYGFGYDHVLKNNPQEIVCVDRFAGAQEHFLYDDKRISFVVADILDYAGEPQSFDVVLCLGTIFYIQNHAALLKKIHALLRPGGVLVINCLNNDLIKRYFGKDLESIDEKFSSAYSFSSFVDLIKNHFEKYPEAYVQLPVKTASLFSFLWSTMCLPFAGFHPRIIRKPAHAEGIYSYLIVEK